MAHIRPIRMRHRAPPWALGWPFAYASFTTHANDMGICGYSRPLS